MAIIGVSDESIGKIKPYVETNGIKYLIAAGGAAGYKTRGIPHAWMVLNGKVVWQGNPHGLQESTIDEFIVGARMPPEFKLPDDLGKADKYLNAGRYAKGIKALESYLKKPRDETVAAAAREALETTTKYGKDLLAAAESYGADGFYLDAMTLLQEVEAAFKGTEIGDSAKEKRSAWKKDKAIKAEIQASTLLKKATELNLQKKLKESNALLLRVIKDKKFEATKARERAEELYKLSGAE